MSATLGDFNTPFYFVILIKGQLYLLVTDQGFLTEEKIVWESLHNVDGDGNFCDSEFHLRPPSDPETVYKGQQDQIDQVNCSPPSHCLMYIDFLPSSLQPSLSFFLPPFPQGFIL